MSASIEKGAMQQGPEAQAVRARNSRIQQDAPDSVPTQWLSDFAPETRNLDSALRDRRRKERLTADVDLVTWLALNNFTGPTYERFAEELAKYGYAVITAWIKKGLIFARCRQRGFGGLPEPPREAWQEPGVAEELGGETVAKALHHFRDDVLMKNKWDAARGATIKTYFIDQCLIRFPNIYRSWRADCRRSRNSALAQIC